MAGVELTAMRCLDCKELVSVVTANACESDDAQIGLCPRCARRSLVAWPIDEDWSAPGFVDT